jgi:hypothetical protein
MVTLFVWCAVLGGALFLVQLVMLVVGFDGFDSDVDVPTGALEGDIKLHEAEVDFDKHPDQWLHNDGWFVGIITFRSIVAAVTVFGLIGMATAQQYDALQSLALATGAGLVTLYAVGWSFKKLYQVRSDGTVRLQQALGQPGTVYLAIPAARTGAGKVTVQVGGRTMEYRAMTDGPALPTNSTVVVTEILNEQTIAVASHSAARQPV